MTESTCPNPACKAKTFEIQKKTIPFGTNKYDFMFVQCTNCGTVIGVLQTGVITNSMVTSANFIVEEVRNAKFEIIKEMGKKH